MQTATEIETEEATAAEAQTEAVPEVEAEAQTEAVPEVETCTYFCLAP